MSQNFQPNRYANSPSSGDSWRNPNSFSIGPLTIVLIGLSIAVAIFSKLGENMKVLEPLFIAGIHPGSGVPLSEVRHGELWRVLTPIFIHFGIMHLVFNMLWLKDLGTAVEKVVGTGMLLAFVLVVGIGANLAEFWFGKHQVFGGMSGVVYGLLGFVWVKSKLDPGSGFFLHNQTALMMVIWFFLCVFGVIPHIANWAHGAGLGLGLLWGFISAMTRSRR
jgi:GlpG protein